MLGLTMLRVVGQQCCVCLHARPLESGGKSIYSSNLHTYTRGGGYFLVKGYWECAAGWGRIFTTALTIMGLNF